MNETSFAQLLALELDSRGLTPYRVALEVGLDPAYLTKVVSGKKTASDQLIEKLSKSKLLGLSLDKLMAMKAAQDYSIEQVKQALKILKGLQDV